MGLNHDIHEKFDSLSVLVRAAVIGTILLIIINVSFPENIILILVVLASRAKYQAEIDREKWENGKL